MITLGIRIFLTIALLWIVWHHAHWSVAVSLALLFVNGELQALVARLKRQP